MITYEDFRDKRREYAFTKSVSDNPKDQDAARKIRTQMDYDDLKKQIGSKKKPDKAAVAEGDVHSGQGEKIQKRTKAWMDKKGQKGAPGLDAMKARTAEHKAKRGEKRHPRDQKELDKAQAFIKKNPNFGKVSEEKDAFKYVLAKLKAKHGDGVLTKGDKMPQPSAAQKKKNAAIRAKRAKEDGRDATEKASDGRYSDRYSNRGSD